MRKAVLVFAALIAVPLLLWRLAGRSSEGPAPSAPEAVSAPAVTFDAGPPPVEGATLRLHVLVDGVPAAQAEAEVGTGKNRPIHQASSPGLIEIRGVAAGLQRLQVRAKEAGESAMQKVQVGDGGVIELTFDLPRGQQIEGVVREPDGGPIECALVSPQDYDAERRAVGEVTYASAAGEHLLTSVDGRFAFTASRTHQRFGLDVKREGYQDFANELRYLDRDGAAVRVTLQPLPRYEGKVIDEHGRAVEHFTANGVSFGGGRFALPLPQGPFELVVAAPGFKPLVTQVDPADPDHVFELDTGGPQDLREAFAADGGTPVFPPGSDGARCPWLYRRFGAGAPH
ncbi:MAG: carboxypeptidase-like regulatory domain-containing protein [Myxococcaceae bacterium]